MNFSLPRRQSRKWHDQQERPIQLMFMKQVVQKWNCLYCFTETHFICKNTAISSKKKNLGGGCKEGDKLDKNELLSFECENLSYNFWRFCSYASWGSSFHVFPYKQYPASPLNTWIKLTKSLQVFFSLILKIQH